MDTEDNSTIKPAGTESAPSQPATPNVPNPEPPQIPVLPSEQDPAPDDPIKHPPSPAQN